MWIICLDMDMDMDIEMLGKSGNEEENITAEIRNPPNLAGENVKN